MIKKNILFILIFCSQSVSAQYYAVGEITGYVKPGIGKRMLPHSKETEPHKIYGVKHEDGKMYKVKRIYADSDVTVTDSNECLVRVTTKYPIYIGRKSKGGYKQLKVQYIKFGCTKQGG